jgi:hypothetical protein
MQSNLLQHGVAPLSKFSTTGLGSPLNSVLESKLNLDFLQQSRCRAGEAYWCLAELPARLGIKTRDQDLGSRLGIKTWD